MQAADKPAPAVENDATMWAGARQPPAIRHLDVVLKPLSRPELGDIRIDAAVFVIGRTEQPFESYGNDVLNMLSRRHASIFRKEGFVYLVDLQSRNGTTVNRSGIGQEPCQLRDGHYCRSIRVSRRVGRRPCVLDHPDLPDLVQTVLVVEVLDGAYPGVDLQRGADDCRE